MAGCGVCPWWAGYILASPLRRLIQDPRSLLAPYVHPGMTVLEPGPGMGFFTLELARLVGPAGRVIARCKSDDSLRQGQLALPNGYGQSYPAKDGARLSNGPRVNLLTDSENRDPIAGTPYHKHVAVRLEKLPTAEAAAYEQISRRIHSA